MRDADLTRLLALLAEERAAILSGRYGALAALGVAKQALARAAFSDRRPGPHHVRGLALMRHNQTLLAAALGGLRVAAEVSGRARGFMSYGSDGRRASIGAGSPSFERKA